MSEGVALRPTCNRVEIDGSRSIDEVAVAVATHVGLGLSPLKDRRNSSGILHLARLTLLALADRTFDEEIGARMGSAFYQQDIHPAIEAAFQEGKKDEEIRDTIRKPWK